MGEDVRPAANRADEAAARYRFHGWQEIRPEQWCARNVTDHDSFVAYASVRYADPQLDKWVRVMAMISSDSDRLETARLGYLKTKQDDEWSSTRISSDMPAEERADAARRWREYQATQAFAQRVWMRRQIRPPAGRTEDMFTRELLFYGWEQVTPEEWCAHHQIEGVGSMGRDFRFTADDRFDQWRQELAVIEDDPALVEAAILRHLTEEELAKVEQFRTNRKQWDADRLAERIAAGANADQPYDYSFVTINDRMSDEEWTEARRRLLEQRAKQS